MKMKSLVLGLFLAIFMAVGTLGVPSADARPKCPKVWIEAHRNKHGKLIRGHWVRKHWVRGHYHKGVWVPGHCK